MQMHDKIHIRPLSIYMKMKWNLFRRLFSFSHFQNRSIHIRDGQIRFRDTSKGRVAGGNGHLLPASCTDISTGCTNQVFLIRQSGILHHLLNLRFISPSPVCLFHPYHPSVSSCIQPVLYLLQVSDRPACFYCQYRTSMRHIILSRVFSTPILPPFSENSFPAITPSRILPCATPGSKGLPSKR